MDMWHLWTSGIAFCVAYLAGSSHISEAEAIIMLTFGVCFLLMPISLGAGLRMERNKSKLKILKPQLDGLKISTREIRPSWRG